MAEALCLKWTDFHSSIVTALESLKCSEDLVDVTLTCEGQNMKAHRVILSACSPYFRGVFKVRFTHKFSKFCTYLGAARNNAIFDIMTGQPIFLWLETLCENRMFFYRQCKKCVYHYYLHFIFIFRRNLQISIHMSLQILAYWMSFSYTIKLSCNLHRYCLHPYPINATHSYAPSYIVKSIL